MRTQARLQQPPVRQLKSGHVGFLVVAKKAVTTQYHFSTTTDGLCKPAGFWGWLQGGRYDHQQGKLSLYPLTRPKRKKVR